MKQKEDIVLGALSNFDNQFSCSQSVVLAFADELGLDKRQAAAVASGFGSGMGDTNGTCGALSGAIMALNMKNAGADPDGKGNKPQIYAKVRELKAEFRAKMGSDVCGNLIKSTIEKGKPKRENCALCVKTATELCFDRIKEE